MVATSTSQHAQPGSGRRQHDNDLSKIRALHRVMKDVFSSSELEELALELDAMESVVGEGVTEQVSNMIRWFGRRRRLDELERAVRIARPNAEWENDSERLTS